MHSFTTASLRYKIKTGKAGVIMGFWIYMLVMDLLIPVSMFAFGKRFQSRPPQTINSAFGYRTSMSMKNEDTWQFAHHYMGRIWKASGIVTGAVTLVVFLFLLGRGENTVGTVGGVLCFLQMLPLIGVIVPTEKALHKAFDKDGRKK